ncbi:MAG: DUF4271 domain-containing protein [Bacteroidota bacterium]
MIIFEPDTAFVCTRNPISDVTFYDSTSLIFTIKSPPPDGFPFALIEAGARRESMAKEMLIRNLREGDRIPAQPFSGDWPVFAVMASIFLYSLISVISRRFFQDMKRFFLFRGVGDPASRDMQVLFNWQSTIINLVSFLNVALFAYCAADYFEFIPDIIPGFIFWLICTLLVIVTVTVRHMVCRVTGNISDQPDAFSEYIITIYLSYRYGAVLLFLISIMILYTGIFKTETLVMAGSLITGAVYLIRVARLFMIFIRKSISIFYLILYLCALEFLPVVVLLKYFAGLF